MNSYERLYIKKLIISVRWDLEVLKLENVGHSCLFANIQRKQKDVWTTMTINAKSVV